MDAQAKKLNTANAVKNFAISLKKALTEGMSEADLNAKITEICTKVNSYKLKGKKEDLKRENFKYLEMCLKDQKIDSQIMNKPAFKDFKKATEKPK